MVVAIPLRRIVWKTNPIPHRDKPRGALPPRLMSKVEGRVRQTPLQKEYPNSRLSSPIDIDLQFVDDHLFLRLGFRANQANRQLVIAIAQWWTSIQVDHVEMERR